MVNLPSQMMMVGRFLSKGQLVLPDDGGSFPFTWANLSRLMIRGSFPFTGSNLSSLMMMEDHFLSHGQLA